MFRALARTMTSVASPRQGVLAAEQMNGLFAKVADSADREAFNALFLFFAPRIKSHLMKVGAAPDLADDLAQEAMLRVWRKAKLFDPQKASAATWIFTIARNLRIDAARRAAKPDLDPNDPAFFPEETPPQDDRIDRASRDGRIRASFVALPPAQHEVVRLHFMEDLTHAEIADRLGTPLGTVKSRLRLAFEKIRKDLGERFE